ncbi:GIP [Symbiodinium sp. CCMP2592]|nr:GIP [Symbiodinium sp. CCMP2592]
MILIPSRPSTTEDAVGQPVPDSAHPDYLQGPISARRLGVVLDQTNESQSTSCREVARIDLRVFLNTTREVPVRSSTSLAFHRLQKDHRNLLLQSLPESSLPPLVCHLASVFTLCVDPKHFPLQMVSVRADTEDPAPMEPAPHEVPIPESDDEGDSYTSPNTSPVLLAEDDMPWLEAIASYKWDLQSFDIRTAFLSNAYGRVDAPLLFYKELKVIDNCMEFLALLDSNRVLREAQEFQNTTVTFQAIPASEVTFVSFGDASFASSRSTLSAEAYAVPKSVDLLGWVRSLWGCIHVPAYPWESPEVGFKMLHPATIVTDCKSLYDLVTRTALPSCEEHRTTLEVLLIRQRCQEHCAFRWVPISLMLADSLTKVMNTELLRRVLSLGRFKLRDANGSLDKASHRRQAIEWLMKEEPPKGD